MSKEKRSLTMLKVVYFDEESASDYLDISAGGRSATTSEQVKDRSKKMHASVEAGLIAKLAWLPFLGATGEMTSGAGASASGRSILSKTLSNTILTDYLAKAEGDTRVAQLRGVRVTAPKGSMAYMKMFTPYMVMMRTDDIPFDFARMDEVLLSAKGYYELLAEGGDGAKRVLRFNIRAFRNNYGLTDLGKMQLVFHGILVGQTAENALDMQAEMSGGDSETSVTAIDLLDRRDDQGDRLEVYDVILAGVEHDG